MTSYRIVLNFGVGERCSNLETATDDLLVAGATVDALRYALETPNREKQQPEIEVYQDGRKRDISDFENEYRKALTKSSRFGSALPRDYKHKR